MAFAKNASRNRDIYAAFETGTPVDQLAVNYALSRNSVLAILTTERHKRAVSLEPAYRELRLAGKGG